MASGCPNFQTGSNFAQNSLLIFAAATRMSLVGSSTSFSTGGDGVGKSCQDFESVEGHVERIFRRGSAAGKAAEVNFKVILKWCVLPLSLGQ
jgi:hypothetical protein